MFFFALLQYHAFASEVLEKFSKGINQNLEWVYEGFPEFHLKKDCASRLELIASFLNDSPIILDAGAHEGEHTVIFANKWPDSTILAFEPNPRAMQTIKDIFRESLQVKTFELALDSSEGKKTFYLCHQNEGSSSLLPSSKYMESTYQGDEIIIESVVLDDWCKTNNVSQIDFMWIDLEGKELDVLMHSKKILKTTKVICTETNFQSFRKNMTQYESLKNYLESLGFTMIAHWYLTDWQGDAIFVKNDLLSAEK